MSAAEWIEWAGTGTTGFAIYWAILIAVAAVEAVFAARPARNPAGPRLAVNLSFGLVAAALGTIPVLSTFVVAKAAQEAGWGLTAGFAWPIAAQIGFAFLVMDLTGYTLHRASHAMPLLWRLHRVHHTDTDVDLSTLFRSHPAAVMVIAAIECAVIVGLGLHPLGVMLHGLAKLITMALGHANLPDQGKLANAVSRLVVTPNFHRIHHSSVLSETDSNYGEVLSIWDRLFASHSRSAGQVERFGLGDGYDSDAASLLSQLKLPFAKS